MEQFDTYDGSISVFDHNLKSVFITEVQFFMELIRKRTRLSRTLKN